MSANVPVALAENGDAEDVSPMAVYLLSDASRGITGQVYTVVGGRIGIWSQPSEQRSMSTETRWTAEEIARRLPDALGAERLPMLDMVDKARAAAAAGDQPNR